MAAPPSAGAAWQTKTKRRQCHGEICGDCRCRDAQEQALDRDGNDTLLGGDGNDVLAGARGADTLTGGRDADKFVFTNVDQSANQPGAFDTITDFEAGIDHIDVSHIDANATTSLLEHFHFPLGSTLHVGEIGSFYDAARNVTVVEANTTGAAVNDFHLELLGHINLTAQRFHSLIPLVVLREAGSSTGAASIEEQEFKRARAAGLAWLG